MFGREAVKTPSIALLALVATAAGAQAQAVSSDTGRGEEIVVTGSRIRRKDLAGAAPVVIFSREQILASGQPTLGDFLQTLPEQSNAINRGTNNAGDGSIRVNLRGLGTQSTLVLLNGRRLPPGGVGADRAVDLTAIPTVAIERIEVLKDGASAIYGSDAIGGVINIITRKRFEGAEVSLFGSTSTLRDGEQVDASALVGTHGAQGGLMAAFTYYDAAPVWAADRAFSRAQYGLDLSQGAPGRVYRRGSDVTPAPVLQLANSELGRETGNARYNALVRQNPTTRTFTRDRSGEWRPFQGSNLPADGGEGLNVQPYNYLVTPSERFSFFSSGDYRLAPELRAYFDAFYTKRSSAQTLAPEALLLDNEGVTVSRDNIYNPFGRDLSAVRRRLVEHDRRTFRQDTHTFHLTAGLDGDLSARAGPFGDWFWDVAFHYDRNASTETRVGHLSVPRLRAAVGPSFVDPTGSPRCGTPSAPIANCVPLDLFGGPGSITQEQLAGLVYTGVQRGYNEQLGAQGSLSGALFRAWAERAIALAIGYEWRMLAGGTLPDPLAVAGETTGNEAKNTAGRYHVHELYGELNIPLVEGLPGIRSIELIAAGRGSFYSNFGGTFNYKLGARWAPSEDLALRGTYSTAFRAPSIPELYQGQQDSFDSVQDPCAASEAGSALARRCGPAADNGDARRQMRARIGGNPRLEPETAKIFTLGFVVEPRALKNLSLSVDYFHTAVERTINPPGSSTILQGCYAAPAVAPKFCELIVRDPTTQRIVAIDNLNANLGRQVVDGVDIAGQYQLALPVGSLQLFAAVAYLHRFDRTLAGGEVIRGAGTWDLQRAGRGGAYPHFRGNAGLTWSHRGFSAAVRTRFIGSYKECGTVRGTLEGGGLCYVDGHVGERWVDAYSTWDLALSYGFVSGAGRSTLSIGGVNLLNAAPPLVYNGGTANTDVYTYDLVMRQIYARLQHQF